MSHKYVNFTQKLFLSDSAGLHTQLAEKKERNLRKGKGKKGRGRGRGKGKEGRKKLKKKNPQKFPPKLSIKYVFLFHS